MSERRACLDFASAGQCWNDCLARGRTNISHFPLSRPTLHKQAVTRLDVAEMQSAAH
jgi:hypothetical protein